MDKPGSATVRGSSSSHPSGFTASSSRISKGASSSQSAGWKSEIKYQLVFSMQKLTDLLGFRVRNSSLVNPVSGLRVFGVLDFLGWVDCGFKVFKKAALLVTLAVDENLIGIIGATKRVRETNGRLKLCCSLDDEGIEVSELLNSGVGSDFEVFLLGHASLGALVTEDEVNLFMR